MSSNTVATSVVFACVVKLFRHEGLRRVSLGSRGAAVGCLSASAFRNQQTNFEDEDSNIPPEDAPPPFHILFHDINSPQSLSLDRDVPPVFITYKFSFQPEPDLYATFTDNDRRHCSEDADKFARTIALVKDYRKRLRWNAVCRLKQDVLKDSRSSLKKVKRKLKKERKSKNITAQEELNKRIADLEQQIRADAMREWTLTPQDLSMGQGDPLALGDSVKVRYTVHLSNPDVIRSSLDQDDGKADLISSIGIGPRIASVGISKIGYKPRGEPEVFTLGDGTHMKGMELGMVGMKMHSRRFIIIPPHLVPNTSGDGFLWGSHITDTSTLLVEVALISVKQRPVSALPQHNASRQYEFAKDEAQTSGTKNMEFIAPPKESPGLFAQTSPQQPFPGSPGPAMHLGPAHGSGTPHHPHRTSRSHSSTHHAHSSPAHEPRREQPPQPSPAYAQQPEFQYANPHAADHGRPQSAYPDHIHQDHTAYQAQRAADPEVETLADRMSRLSKAGGGFAAAIPPMAGVRKPSRDDSTYAHQAPSYHDHEYDTHDTRDTRDTRESEQSRAAPRDLPRRTQEDIKDIHKNVHNLVDDMLTLRAALRRIEANTSSRSGSDDVAHKHAAEIQRLEKENRQLSESNAHLRQQMQAVEEQAEKYRVEAQKSRKLASELAEQRGLCTELRKQMRSQEALVNRGGDHSECNARIAQLETAMENARSTFRRTSQSHEEETSELVREARATVSKLRSELKRVEAEKAEMLLQMKAKVATVKESSRREVVGLVRQALNKAYVNLSEDSEALFSSSEFSNAMPSEQEEYVVQMFKLSFQRSSKTVLTYLAESLPTPDTAEDEEEEEEEEEESEEEKEAQASVRPQRARSYGAERPRMVLPTNASSDVVTAPCSQSSCSCSTFVKNPWKPEICKHCAHPHSL